MTVRCKRCNGNRVQLGYWANPNTKNVQWDEPLFDVNQAPETIGVQWCVDCQDHTELLFEDDHPPTKTAPDGEKIIMSTSCRWHVEDHPASDDLHIVDENRLIVGLVQRPYLVEDEPATLLAAGTMAAAPQMLDALSTAITFLTDPGATDGQEAVEAAINAAAGSD